MEATPNFGVSLDTSFILGMAKRGEEVKILLDIDRVLSSKEFELVERAAVSETVERETTQEELS